MPAREDDLGQHLLADEAAIRRVLAVAALPRGARVLDAGAGAGALTRPLAEAVGPEGRVVAVEIDPAMLARLREDLPGNVEVVAGDLLSAEWPARLDAVVANPPFRLAAPLVERIAAAGVPRSTLVVPRELTERLAAKPGSDRYGKLTVRVALRAVAEDRGGIPRRSFEPPPEVGCGILRLTARADPVDVDAAALDRVLDAAWAARGRKAKHALAPLATEFRADTGGLSRLLAERAEADEVVTRLSPEAFAAVAAYLTAKPRA